MHLGAVSTGHRNAFAKRASSNGIDKVGKTDDIYEMLSAITHVLRQTFKFLAFRKVKIDLQAYGAVYFVAVVLMSWVAGLGRYWDHPNALSR